MWQGKVDAIGTYYELQSSGLDLQKTIAEANIEQEEKELRKSFSESEAETSLSRYGSVSSSLRKRRESIASKSSVTEVISIHYLIPIVSILVKMGDSIQV